MLKNVSITCIVNPNHFAFVDSTDRNSAESAWKCEQELNKLLKLDESHACLTRATPIAHQVCQQCFI